MERPFEYRCAHCQHSEEVLVEVEEEGALGHLSSESALSYRPCPRCHRRDWISVVVRLCAILAIAHLGFGVVVFAVGVGGRSLRGLPEIVAQGPWAVALFWGGCVVLTVLGTLSGWGPGWGSRGIRVRR